MTALSLALSIPDRVDMLFGCEGDPEGGGPEAAAFNAHQCRMFLLALESLLQRQWTHYSGGGRSHRPGEGGAALRRYFTCGGGAHHRLLNGSGAAGPLRDFIYRLVCHSRCSVECYPIAVALADRFFVAMRKESDATEYEAAVDHFPCVFAVLLLITAKYRDDKFRSNRYFSQLAELLLVEWNALERLVIHVLEFNVSVPLTEYIVYEKLLLEEMERQEIIDSTRGSVGIAHHCGTQGSLSLADVKIDVAVSSVDPVEATIKDNSSFNSCDITASPPSRLSQCPPASAETSPVFDD